MAEIMGVRCRRQNFAPIMGVILGAGFSVATVARLIRSTPPTVRAIARGECEPKYSQGVTLFTMQKLIKAGKLKAEDKDNG